MGALQEKRSVKFKTFRFLVGTKKVIDKQEKKGGRTQSCRIKMESSHPTTQLLNRDMIRQKILNLAVALAQVYLINEPPPVLISSFPKGGSFPSPPVSTEK